MNWNNLGRRWYSVPNNVFHESRVLFLDRCNELRITYFLCGEGKTSQVSISKSESCL